MDVRSRRAAAPRNSKDNLIGTLSRARGPGARRGLPVASAGDGGKRQREKERGKSRNLVPARKSS